MSCAIILDLAHNSATISSSTNTTSTDHTPFTSGKVLNHRNKVIPPQQDYDTRSLHDTQILLKHCPNHFDFDINYKDQKEYKKLIKKCKHKKNDKNVKRCIKKKNKIIKKSFGKSKKKTKYGNSSIFIGTDQRKEYHYGNYENKGPREVQVNSYINHLSNDAEYIGLIALQKEPAILKHVGKKLRCHIDSDSIIATPKSLMKQCSDGICWDSNLENCSNNTKFYKVEVKMIHEIVQDTNGNSTALIPSNNQCNISSDTYNDVIWVGVLLEDEKNTDEYDKIIKKILVSVDKPIETSAHCRDNRKKCILTGTVFEIPDQKIKRVNEYS